MSETEEKKIQRTIVFSTETYDMLMQIQKGIGQKTLTGVFAHIVYETHRRMFPAYIAAKVPRETKAEREAGERLSAEEVQLDIAKRLDGKITEEGGTKVCTYYTYAMRDRYDQKFSLSLLTEDMVRNQYQPSREVVERLIKEKKVRWK